MTEQSSLRRRLASRVLLVITFLLAVVTGPTLYASSVIADEDAFVAVADQVLAHPDVRTATAEVATSVMFEAISADETVADLLPGSARSLAVPLTSLATARLTDAAFDVLDTDLAVEVRESALREVHGQVTEDSDEVVVDLRAVLVRTSREIGGPAAGAGVAKLVSDSETGRFTLAEPGSSESRLFAFVRTIPAIGLALAVAMVASLAGAIALAANWRRTLLIGGLAVAAGALFATFATSIGLFILLAALSGGSGLGAAVAEVITADFAAHQRGTVVLGVGLAVTGLLLGDRPSAIALRSLPRDVWQRRPGTADTIAAVIGDNPPLARTVVWLTGVFTLALWSAPTWRAVMTIILLTMAGVGLVWLMTSTGPSANEWRHRIGITVDPPDSSLHGDTHRLRVNVAAVGLIAFLLWPGWERSLVVAFFSTFGLLLGAVDLPAARRVASQVADDAVVATEEPSRRRLVIAGVVTLGVLLIAVVSTLGSTDVVEASAGCNGHAELCDRPVDEVVFAGSHNSMSSTDLGWELAMQTGDIVTQLDHGVRALLIDALYWSDTGSLDGGNDGAMSVIEGALGDDEPRPGTWLCHGFCALGATDLVGGLTDIKLWLDSNPREVLMIVVQDEITTADLTSALEASELTSLIHRNQAATFPTLGELIERNERVLIYAENGGESGSLYQNAWEATFTETPFAFGLRSDFSCEPNRGDEDNPLFLINHWLTTGIPVREAAVAVNSRVALLERVEDCRRERGRSPTVLATDFVETGDLVAVVDELNGVGG